MKKPTELLKEAIARFKINPKLFLGIVLVPVIANVLMALFAPSKATGVINIYEWLVFSAFVIAYIATYILMGIALILAADNTALSIKEAYRQSKGFFWRYLGFTIVASLILLIGFLLLFIPGVILLVWFAFSVFILVLDNAGIKESLDKSRAYVKGKWWAVFGRILFAALIAIVVMLPFSILAALFPSAKQEFELVGNIVAMLISPITLLYMYLLYLDVKSPNALAS